jgi:hypothetical protein
MILFISRVLLWCCVLAGMTLLWVAFLDADEESFQRSLDRNASLLVGYLTDR